MWYLAKTAMYLNNEHQANDMCKIGRNIWKKCAVDWRTWLHSSCSKLDVTYGCISFGTFISSIRQSCIKRSQLDWFVPKMKFLIIKRRLSSPQNSMLLSVAIIQLMYGSGTIYCKRILKALRTIFFASRSQAQGEFMKRSLRGRGTLKPFFNIQTTLQ